MVTATFRFYEELNDFIAPFRRRRAFSCRCACAATAKHMIEALGVPHTEVALVLVNGESAPFGQILHDGDRVAVYPRFGSFDISSLQRLREHPRPSPRFIADAHLGGLARMLRMAGFDTLYDKQGDDADIASIAETEERVVLTRDRDLLMRKGIVHGCYVRALKAEQQLQEVASRLDLLPSMRPFTLCLRCNAPLKEVTRAEIDAPLPPAVEANQTVFSTCALCQGVFWKGSHWQRMRAVLMRCGMQEVAVEGASPLFQER